MRVVPVDVGDVDAHDAAVELALESRHNLLLADLAVEALVVHVQLDEARADFHHHRDVLRKKKTYIYI